MSSKFPQTFRLGPWTIEPLRGVVAEPNGESQHLEPKVMDVFVCLAEHINEIVTREQLLDAAWGGNSGSDDQLTRAIGELRRVFRDNPRNPQYIETVPKRGYRLLGVHDLADVSESVTHKVPLKRTNRFTGKNLLFMTAAILTLAFVYDAFDDSATDSMQEAATGSARSIAVLPFVSMSDDPRDELFSDGLAEEIRTMLVGIPNLKVIARTSSFAFKGKNEDLRVIGQTLGVETVLEGSVRRLGDRVRITAQLVDVSDGTNIWSDSFNRNMTDVFAVQDDIAAAIIDALEIHITTNPTRGRPTQVAEAYNLYLKAKVLLDIQHTQTAELALLEATELDPDFAKAHELLAHLYWMQDIPEMPLAEAQKLMRKSAARAIEIDADLVFAQALHQLGNTENYSLPDVIEALLTAARKRPNDSAILRTLTWELLMAGYLNESLRVAERFVEVDPLSSMAHIRRSAALSAVGRANEAMAAFKVAALLTPNNMDWYFGEIELAQQRDDAAIEYFEASLRQRGQADTAWVADLVAYGRDPASGQAYLDERIPAVVQSVQPADIDDFQDSLQRWYLFFGHLDRYFEIVLGRIPGSSTRAGVYMFLWYGTLHRNLGFTAHPKYLEVAEMMGFIDVWERRGPPDYCSKVDGNWICE